MNCHELKCADIPTGAGWSHCAAPGCHLDFASDAAFREHRVGKFDAPKGDPEGRRCMTMEELTAAGLEPNEAGRWRRPMTEEQRAAMAARFA